MSQLAEAKVVIRGVRPLFQHLFGPDALPLTPKEKVGVAGNSPSEWQKTCIFDMDGKLYLPPEYIFASIRDGSKNIKQGRGSIQNQVVATLQVKDDRVYLLDGNNGRDPLTIPNYCKEAAMEAVKEGRPKTAGLPKFHPDETYPSNETMPTDPDMPVYLDIRGVRNPSTRARNVRYRVACRTGWEAEFTILWDLTVVDRRQMESACHEAGRLAGVGNGRALGMGRYTIVSFELTEL